jgi:carboxymethylenebutenolidase
MKGVLVITLILWVMSTNAQDYALKRLENSPRHHEWVQVENKGRKINCFIAYPEVSGKATVVIVIHENRGLTDWVRSFTDRLAEAGYIAIAPDMLSDFSSDKKRTSDFASQDDARNAIYMLDAGQVESDLNAVQAYAESIQAGNGKTVAVGFCWGGSQCFRFACNNNRIKAALVFYGSAPEQKEEIEKISAPVYGFYGGNDERIDAGIPATEQLMKETGKKYDYVIYTGAGHAFMRLGEDPEGIADNRKAFEESWVRLLSILKGV